MAYTILTPPKPRDSLIKPSEYIDEAPPGRVLWLKNRRSDKIWYDESEHGNHGTINGATWTAKGRRGPALSFDAIDDYVNCGSDESLTLNGSFTLEVWASFISESGEQCLIDKEGGGKYNYFFMQSGGKLRLELFDGVNNPIAWSAGGSVNPGSEFRHLVAVVNKGVDIRFFIDGLPSGTPVAETTGDLTTGAVTQIGRRGITRVLNGMIDEANIYNKALSAAEIRALYEQGRP